MQLPGSAAKKIFRPSVHCHLSLERKAAFTHLFTHKKKKKRDTPYFPKYNKIKLRQNMCGELRVARATSDDEASPLVILDLCISSCHAMLCEEQIMGEPGDYF